MGLPSFTLKEWNLFSHGSPFYLFVFGNGLNPDLIHAKLGLAKMLLSCHSPESNCSGVETSVTQEVKLLFLALRP